MADDTGFAAVPSRYALEGGREAIDVLRGELGDEAFEAFCRGTARLYELRAGKKGPAENDLEKARWYWMMADHVRGVGPDPRTYRRA